VKEWVGGVRLKEVRGVYVVVEEVFKGGEWVWARAVKTEPVRANKREALKRVRDLKAI